MSEEASKDDAPDSDYGKYLKFNARVAETPDSDPRTDEGEDE